jgi:hypothetical protein
VLTAFGGPDRGKRAAGGGRRGCRQSDGGDNSGLTADHVGLAKWTFRHHWELGCYLSFLAFSYFVPFRCLLYPHIRQIFSAQSRECISPSDVGVHASRVLLTCSTCDSPSPVFFLFFLFFSFHPVRLIPGSSFRLSLMFISCSIALNASALSLDWSRRISRYPSLPHILSIYIQSYMHTT